MVLKHAGNRRLVRSAPWTSVSFGGLRSSSCERSWPSGAGLVTLNAGAMTAGGTATAGPRVMLPFGRAWMLGEQDAIRFVRDRLPGFVGKVQGMAATLRMRDEPATLRIEGDQLTGDAHPGAVVDADSTARTAPPCAGLPTDFTPGRCADPAGVPLA